jgi:RNA methyltransferase, TrmH family
VLAAESAEVNVREILGPTAALRILPDSLFRQLPSVENSQGVLALVEPPQFTIDEILAGTLVVVLDGVQDPGNAGTIVRAAEAFGATGAIFLKGSVNPWNPKTLRASAGSLFRFPVCSAVSSLGTHPGFRRLTVFASMASSAKPIGQADFTRRCAIVIGNEAHGVSEEMRAGAIGVMIPTQIVESLNAGVAASVILYEASRQRALAT